MIDARINQQDPDSISSIDGSTECGGSRGRDRDREARQRVGYSIYDHTPPQCRDQFDWFLSIGSFFLRYHYFTHCWVGALAASCCMYDTLIRRKNDAATAAAVSWRHPCRCSCCCRPDARSPLLPTYLDMHAPHPTPKLCTLKMPRVVQRPPSAPGHADRDPV